MLMTTKLHLFNNKMLKKLFLVGDNLRFSSFMCCILGDNCVILSFENLT